MSDIDRVVDWFESLTPESLARIGDVYAPAAWFKDPFNEVRGVDQIERIFRHMFVQVCDPAFRVTERIGAPNGVFLAWNFTFRFRPGAAPVTVPGASHLRFDSAGRIEYHRDYWDPAAELYERLPGVGWLMRRLRKRLAAPR